MNVNKHKLENVQSVVFNKKTYHPDEAESLLEVFKLKPIKQVHITRNDYRYRIKNPVKGKQYRTYDTGYGIKFVYWI